MQRRRQRAGRGRQKKKGGMMVTKREKGSKKEEKGSAIILPGAFSTVLPNLTKSSWPKQLKMLPAINLFSSLSLYHPPPFQRNGYLLIFQLTMVQKISLLLRHRNTVQVSERLWKTLKDY